MNDSQWHYDMRSVFPRRQRNMLM